MEFFIFLCFMSFVSFAVAFLAYGLVIRLMGTTSSASRYSQIILVPIAIIGYDFLTITASAEYRYVIGDENYCEDCMISCFRVPNF